MLAIGLIEQVIDAGTHFDVLVNPIGRIGGKDGESPAAVEILTRDVPFV